ncbi:prepilin-type N-terminal cleavage/methylation domain-containing protein [Demequina sp.]|uniref:prepilin-type N-terminal cleavage/methylation domain-containing protein n=1 Tax=Demequina sp. TaxID=2050685 RepID=UPI003A8685DA
MTVPTARRGSDAGYSMVELLVVIVIIGILAAIAIPLYLDHQRKANDAAAQSDAMNLGTLVRAAWDESAGTVTVAQTDDSYTINGESVLGVSPGVDLVEYRGTTLENWCLELNHPHGDKANNPAVRFDAQNGYVEQASC